MKSDEPKPANRKKAITYEQLQTAKEVWGSPSLADAIKEKLNAKTAMSKWSRRGKAKTHKASLRLHSKTLRLYIDGNTTSYKVKQFKSLSLANYKACRNLCFRKKSWLTKEQLDITEAKTAIKDLPRTMGITGPLQQHFLEFNSENQTIRLLDIVKLTKEELDELVEYVKAQFKHKS